MTPTARLTTALRALADALEGPLPCSDPEMPARRILDRLAMVRNDKEAMEDRVDAAFDVAFVLRDTVYGNARDALWDAGLCDE